MKLNIKISIIFIIIGTIFVTYAWISLDKKDNLVENNIIEKKVSKELLNQIIEIANLDSEEYPLTPFSKMSSLKEYNNEEKDNIIIYYSKRKNIAIPYKNDNIELCKITQKCYSITEEDYKEILKIYDFEEYENVYLQKENKLYYFVYERIVGTGKVKHNVKAKYGENETIIVEDNMAYDEYGLGESRKKITYIFTIKNNNLALTSIKE